MAFTLSQLQPETLTVVQLAAYEAAKQALQKLSTPHEKATIWSDLGECYLWLAEILGEESPLYASILEEADGAFALGKKVVNNMPRFMLGL